MIVLDDAVVRARLRPEQAVQAVRAALAGELAAPARIAADLGDGKLMFTAGRLAGVGYGFRAYDTRPTSSTDQVTVVFDDSTGLVRGVVTGPWLGEARTGAIGAVAVGVLARPDAAVLGLVGTGKQAWAQLWAIRSVRSLREVRVYGRDPRRREEFVARARAQLELPAVPADSARIAVGEAEIVVLATNSGVPVIDASWISPGTHVTTLGPKEINRHECPIELAAGADVLVTDSLAQLDGYANPFFLDETPHRSRIRSLASIMSELPSAAQTTLFCSVGLAGTEVAVAATLL
jgi:ornithine cyclodeaminase/alanine dehydrogenase-like protein (mu-crystallin family)